MGRLGRLLGVVVLGWWWVRVDFPRLSASQQQERVVQWATKMLSALGLRLRVHGAGRVQGGALLAANHISWVDVLALYASGACRFVAKAEVHHWPMVGAMAAGAGTLFIERQSPRDAMRVMHQMAQVMRDNGTVAVFPEGTTSTGETVTPFHANLFQAAITAQVPVQGIAIAYFDENRGHCSPQIAYVGDDSLLSSLWDILLASRCVIELAVADPSPYAGQSRRQWAAHIQQQVQYLHTMLLHSAGVETSDGVELKGF